MSCSETSIASSSNRCMISVRITIPGRIAIARSGCRPLTCLRCSSGIAARRSKISSRSAAREPVAVDALGVVGVEILGDRGQRGRRAGHAERPAGVGAVAWPARPASRIARTSWATASSSVGRRRIGADVAVGLAHDAGLGRDVEVDAGRRGRSRARSSRRRCRRRASARRRGSAVELIGGAEVGELRLLVAGDHVHVEAEAARRRRRRTRRRWRRRARRSSSPRPPARARPPRSAGGTRRAPRTRARARRRRAGRWRRHRRRAGSRG